MLSSDTLDTHTQRWIWALRFGAFGANGAKTLTNKEKKEETVLKDLDPPSIPPTIPAHCATRKPFRFIEFIVTQKWAADNEKRMDTFIGSDEMENVSAAIGKTSVAIVCNFNCQEVAARNLFKYSNSRNSDKVIR